MAKQPRHCYNKGCNKEFITEDNHTKSCVHHPGDPYFHDIYKEWTCCKKRSVDFTEFLSIKGCTTSYHSDVKSVEKPKLNADREFIEEPAEKALLKPPEPLSRPSSGEPMIPLSVIVTPSLRSALAPSDQLAKLKVDKDAAVKLGDPCQHRGCGKVYEGAKSDREECVFHSGGPVFHEGMKYWSCCQRKTSEFDEFLKQVGCERGDHVWKKTETELKAVQTCRSDWYQTTSHVYATFYAKNTVPEKSFVQANQVKMKVKLVFDAGESLFEKEMELGGIINLSESEVTMAGPKVEVKMKKAEFVAWKSLELSRFIQKEEPAAATDKKE